MIDAYRIQMNVIVMLKSSHKIYMTSHMYDSAAVYKKFVGVDSFKHVTTPSSGDDALSLGSHFQVST